ncbi:ATP12 family chaperone protein [Phyllobacterium leguminum]|uniref:Chaperone required for assembly of F1-ATPase n=1 Tax=Phyllobacterium leguminum TaxID=314237 RepID=A0A318SZ87_9HYPH|nr:ATP12 family protein [Phyllobacterium leguminum]PYE86813.1 chaperone required for assembly of F1-ATPase [Phyllobacterium leguminum]
MRDILNDLENGEGPDPMRRAQEAMRTPLPKKFYTAVTVAEADGGYGVYLDGKPVRTPGRRALILPTSAAAQIVADEFALQQKIIDPAQMPATRLANTAIDGVADDPQAVVEDLLRFVASDMLFYRADAPEELVKRQAEGWDPLIDWASSALNAHFILAEGVMHVAQPREALAAFGVHIKAFSDPIALAALHTMTTLTGSAILALAIARGEIGVREGWKLAHLDEDWTVEHWGEDAEAQARRAAREEEMMAAAAMLAATSSS